MNLNYETLFNGLSLIIYKLINHAMVEKIDNQEYYNIFIHSSEIIYARFEEISDFEEIINFLHYKNKEGIRLFDVVCFFNREKKDEEDFNEFQNNKYGLSFSKELVIFIQDLFCNLKEIYYDEKDKKLIFDFINKAFDEKRLPFFKVRNKYIFDDEIFNEDEKEISTLINKLIIRNIETQNEIKDNLKMYSIFILPKNKEEEQNYILNDIRKFYKGTKAYEIFTSIQHGKNKYKHVDNIIDIQDNKTKIEEEYITNYLKEKIFRDMYTRACFKGAIRKSVMSKANQIYYTLVLLKKVKYHKKEKDIYSILSNLDSFIKMHRISNYISKSFMNRFLDIIKTDKKIVYRNILNFVADFYSVNIVDLDDAVDYVKNEDAQCKYFYELCRAFHKDLVKNDSY